MFKIPFLEHTIVALEITEEVIRWVEVDRLGKGLKLDSYGEVRHNGSEVNFLASLEEVKQQINTEAYKVGVSLSFALKEIMVEEMPYFEEPEDAEKWLANKEKGVKSRFFENDRVRNQSIQLDEDSRREIFQILDGDIVERYIGYLAEADLYPVLTTSGITEFGYSQLFEEYFTEDFTGVIVISKESAFLNVYQGGLIQNIYPLLHSVDDIEGLVDLADSYLKSEENASEITMGTIPLVLDFDVEIGKDSFERELKKAKPMPSNKGFEGLIKNYNAVVGVAIKTLYQEMDAFNFVPESISETGIKQHDKKEFIRISVLLFVPLIFFFLLIFGAGKLVDYQLIESNQIMGQIGDRIDYVNSERKELLDSRDQFLEIKSLLAKREVYAPIFEYVAQSIPDGVWLDEFIVSKTSGGIKQVRLGGYSQRDRDLTEFLELLEHHEEVNSVQLIFSEAVEQESVRSRRTSVSEIVPKGTIQFELMCVVD